MISWKRKYNKNFIIKALTDNQATDQVKTTRTPKIHQQDTII